MDAVVTVALVVRDYDEAIAFYVGALGFDLVSDDDLGGGRRWVVVGPAGERGARLLLAKATTDSQQSRVGDQTGGRVGFFLATDDFVARHAQMRENGVRFLEEPRVESYGMVAVFEDLYGNRWDLIETR